MRISRRSPLTGEINIMDLPITLEQYKKWRNGEHIQVAMPQLTPAQREFILSGATEDDWEQMFPEEEEDDDDYYYPNQDDAAF